VAVEPHLGAVAPDFIDNGLHPLLGVDEHQCPGGVDDVDALRARIDHRPGVARQHLRGRPVREHQEPDSLHA